MAEQEAADRAGLGRGTGAAAIARGAESRLRRDGGVQPHDDGVALSRHPAASIYSGALSVNCSALLRPPGCPSVPLKPMPRSMLLPTRSVVPSASTP